MKGKPRRDTNLSKKSIFFAASLYAALNCATAAFGAGTSVLADAVQAELTKLTSAAIDARARHDSYIQLARMLSLSGDIEGAASAWENAAYADPKSRNDTALLESASCYVSMGEWEKAGAIVKLLLLTARDDKNISKRTIYLNGQIEAFHYGNTAALELIADDKEYLVFSPAIYYTLWQVSGQERYKAKLLSRFPDSPEAYSIMGSGGALRVSALPSVGWLLFPGREEFRAVSAKSAPPAQPPLKTDPIPAQQSAASSASASAPPAQAAAVAALSQNSRTDGRIEARVLQTGLYKHKGNASLQFNRLKAAGFNADISARTVSGEAYWTVSIRVPSDSTQKDTIQRLKEHGFDAFPTP
jgi:tetratricopeptide (TPR) repeat protein